MTWFDPKSIALHTDNASLNKALDLFRLQRVLEIEISKTPEGWLVAGLVQGSLRKPYRVNIQLKLTPQSNISAWTSICSCPVTLNCKHGVALLMKAAYQGQNILHTAPVSKNTVTAAPKKDYEIEMLQRQSLHQAEDWLRSLQKLRTVAVSATTDSSARDDQFIYLLCAAHNQRQQPVLQLEAATCYHKANGDWTKPKPCPISISLTSISSSLATLQDIEIIQLISTMPYESGAGFHQNRNLAVCVPYGQTGLMALQMAAKTGKLFLKNDDGYPGSSITWSESRRFDWCWETVSHSNPRFKDKLHYLKPLVEQEKTAFLYNNPPVYLDYGKMQCGALSIEGMSLSELLTYLNAPALPDAALKKIQNDFAISKHPAIPFPSVMQKIKTISGVQPIAKLHIQANGPADVKNFGLLRVNLQFDYQGHRGFWLHAHPSVDISTAKQTIVLVRDLKTETGVRQILQDAGLELLGKDFFLLPQKHSQQQWLNWASSDYAEFRQAGCDVTLDDSLKDWISKADQLQVDLLPDQTGTDQPQWFDLSLGIEINGKRHNILSWLPVLIASISNRPLDSDSGLPVLPTYYYIPAPNGNGFTQIPLEPLKPWVAALLELSEEKSKQFEGDSLRLSRFDALRTGAALGEGVMWQGSNNLTAMIQKLRGQAELPVVKVPKEVNATLRPYQQQGLNWLQFLREHGLAGILADDMGLGKTLQVLVHIQCEKNAGRLDLPVLIIAPVSLMGNWLRETQRFCPTLRAIVLHGKERHEAADSISSSDIVIAPYSLLQRDRQRWIDLHWHMVVLDEAQNIKNAITNAAQIVGQLNTRHRLCLSGTPMENHLGEIWSLFHFLMPGFLGSQTRFKTLFRNPIEKQGHGERMQQLRSRITPFMLRRTKALVANELPPRVDTVMRVELTGAQADLYETIRLGMEKTVREALNQKGLAKSHIAILDALLKLRQVCCDPQLLPLSSAKKIKCSAKMEQLMEVLPEMLAEGRRVLLFSQFTSMLTLIEAELKKRDIQWAKLTGQSQKRDAIIDSFTSGEVPLFLISLKAGGVGLNLPQADTVIHFDPWWNPAVENQATDRAHRIGQTQSVWVVKMVAQGTIEDRILALQERKAQLANTMYSASTERKQPLFSETDLEELLKPLSR